MDTATGIHGSRGMHGLGAWVQVLDMRKDGLGGVKILKQVETAEKRRLLITDVETKQQ